MPLAHFSRIGGNGNRTPDLLHGRPEYVPIHHQPTICKNLVDVKAAFDPIRRDFIWVSMRHHGLPEKYARIFLAFFKGTVSAVRVNGESTDWFSVNSGTGQGGIQGPPIFNFCLN